jgi:cell division control protein 45
MYLPRGSLPQLYLHLQRTRHPLSPPVLILVALEPDALCGCRILTTLLKRDYIPHKIQPIAGFSDLEKAGIDNVQPMLKGRGGEGGVVVCLGVGARNDLGVMLGISTETEGEGAFDGVEVWVVDSQRPWHLENVFGGAPREVLEDGTPGTLKIQPGVDKGRLERVYRAGTGGVIVFDDGDIHEDLQKEREAYFEIDAMPAIDDNYDDGSGSESDEENDGDDDTPMMEAPKPGQKRKSWSDREEEDSDDDEDMRAPQRRRSNSVSNLYHFCTRHMLIQCSRVRYQSRRHDPHDEVL